MRFDDSETPTNEAELTRLESLLGISLPLGLRQQYLRANGGSPAPYVYADDNLDTVVSSFLPISSTRGHRTAVDTYELLVRNKRVVPLKYFPFAVDGGGDYFFVDCASEHGAVLFYRSDVTDGEDPLLALGVNIDEFWSSLKEE